MASVSYQIANLLEKVKIAVVTILTLSFIYFNFIHAKMYLLSILDFLQMTSSDKDFRFMATNDLMTELQKDSIKLDDDSERKVVRMLLKLLEDKNGEVQNLAVKW